MNPTSGFTNSQKNSDNERNTRSAASQTPLWMGTLLLFLPDDKTATPEEMQKAQERTAYLLLMMAENSDTELTNKIIELGESYLATEWTNEEFEVAVKEDEKFREFTAEGPIPWDWDQNTCEVC